MLLVDSPLRFFVWTERRGSYGTMTGALGYVVYREQIYVLGSHLSESLCFDSVPQLIDGHYREVDSVATMLEQIRKLQPRTWEIWQDNLAVWQDHQRLLDKLKALQCY